MWIKTNKKNIEAPFKCNQRINNTKLTSSVKLIKSQKEITDGVNKILKNKPVKIWTKRIIPKNLPMFQ